MARLMRVPIRITRFRQVLASWLLLALLNAPCAESSREKGVAATVHPRATVAAIEALKEGGNAIDAAVAAALTLGVVDGHNSGIGGGCFMLIRPANGEVVAIDGREMAPAAAVRDMYLREGKADLALSQTGALAPGVPGALAAYDYATTKYGRLTLARSLRAAAQVAREGFPINRSYASALKATAEELRKFAPSRAIFLDADGKPRPAGDILKQPDLAGTYDSIAQHGIRWFYEGPFAEKAGAWMKENGGIMTAEDFRRYKVQLRAPVETGYRDCQIYGFPPPSSGGVHVAQILNILENFQLEKMDPNSADFIHLTAEAMKLAFADRAYWLGDPDFARVPTGLVDRGYGARLAKRIDLHQANAVTSHDLPPEAETQYFGKHTTHFSTADAEGNWVACTATINTSFGSKVVVPGTGVVLNNQMDDFSAQPGVANFFGLVGAEANAVGPGKRPLSSMSPTVVVRNGKPILSVGAAGGPTIISQTLLAILRVVDFGLPLDKALAQPRFHHQWRPDELRIEKKAGEAVIRELEARGHKVTRVDNMGVTQAVGKDANGRFAGAPDPRGEGQALVW